MKILFAVTVETPDGWATRNVLTSGVTADAAMDAARSAAVAASGEGSTTRNIQTLGVVDLEG